MTTSPKASDGQLEACCTTGSSPGHPTLHLMGPGAVGRALLRRLPDLPLRLVAVSDSRGTLEGPRGLDPRRVAEVKQRTGRVSPARRPLTAALLDAIGADILVDTTATTPGRTEWHDLLEERVSRGGSHLVLAAKDALCARADRWGAAPLASRIRYNAVLGGSGAALHEELDELRPRTDSVAVSGNATTTAIISVIEDGGSLADGISVAADAGLLEADPELDFRGVDAAVKLATVAGLLGGSVVEPNSIPCEDVRKVDPHTIRERASRGSTTRLIGRWSRRGDLQVRYEEVRKDSPLAVPGDRVAYLYQLNDGASRVHVGDGLGANGTAAAVLRDLATVVDRSSPVAGGSR